MKNRSATTLRLNEFEHFMQDRTKAELGALLADYLHESGHGGWEGFQPSEVRAISKFLEDMKVYWNNLSNDDRKRITTERSTSNGLTYWTKD